MREILFRGKCVETGEWVYGFLVKHPSVVAYNDYSPWYIHVPPVDPDDNIRIYNVIAETVGQYTGLTDKNGKRIFEGDVVEVIHEGVYRCCWDEGNFEFGLINGTESFGIAYVSPDSIVVIGNIHDNPELLEVGNGK